MFNPAFFLVLAIVFPLSTAYSTAKINTYQNEFEAQVERVENLMNLAIVAVSTVSQEPKPSTSDGRKYAVKTLKDLMDRQQTWTNKLKKALKSALLYGDNYTGAGKNKIQETAMINISHWKGQGNQLESDAEAFVLEMDNIHTWLKEWAALPSGPVTNQLLDKIQDAYV